MKIIYSPTVHLLIVHGAEIIRNSPVAPGFLSKEGSEHNNKIVRYNREHHARQISIKDNLKDCFVRSSNASDPVILHMIEEQILRKRSSERPISAEAYELLKPKNEFDDVPCETDSKISSESENEIDEFAEE